MNLLGSTFLVGFVAMSGRSASAPSTLPSTPPRPVDSSTSSSTPSSTSWLDRQQWPLLVGAGVDSIGFYPQATHPVGLLGTELTHLARPRFALLQPIELSYHYHRYVAHGPALDTGLEARWNSRIGLYVGGSLGLGVQHVFVPDRTYESTGTEFAPGGNRGHTSARVPLSVNVGYDFGAKTRSSLRVFARYQQLLLVPWAPGNELPIMGRARVLVGIAIPLANRKRR